MTAVPISGKYHISINGQGYIISHKRSGEKWYEKKLAPAFVNKFGSGDVSYRDSTFWQFWATTNWRNGSKQLQLDDPGKFWKSSDVNTSQLNELTLSRALTSLGQVAPGININALSAWRTSQSWWNASYAYRKQLTITAALGAQVPAGYPVKVTEDTAALETATKVRSDRKDWRVVYFNGSTWTDLSRDYVSTTSTYFGLQAAIESGQSDTNYYLYYGYSGESTTKQPSTDTEWNAVYGMYGTTPDSNTKAIFHFREGTGSTVNDDSTGTNNGTGTNLTWGTDGKFGRYGIFSASNTYVNAGTSSDLALGSMTIEGWFYHTGGASEVFISKGVETAPNPQTNYELANLTGGDGAYLRQNDGSAFQSSGKNSGVMTASTWTHVAVTFDGTSTTKWYKDGVLQSNDVNAISGGLTNSGGPFQLGRSHDTGARNYWGGRMQHIRVSNVARTSFPYVLATEPTATAGTETTTQPSQSTADAYAGGSDGKIYKHDGLTTWTEQFDARRITWYDDSASVDTNKVVGDTGGTETAQAMAFQIAAAQTIKGVEAYLKKASGTPGDITVRIETDNAGVPSGTLAHANATATITSFSTSSYAWVSKDFTTAFALSATTTYWLVLKTAAASNDTNYNWGADASSPSYTSGNMAASTDGGSTWSAVSGTDALFRIKGESTQINDMLVSSVGGTLKMLIATGDITSQTNGNARIFSFDGTNYALEKTFTTSTESQVTKLAEYNSKLYAGVGPQARVYEGTSPSSWTLSKDIDVPSKPGYIYALKEYNQRLYAGGGAPELLYDKHYNGFWYTYDQNTWQSLYPFDFTELRAFEFYDSFLFGSTYDGRIYVYDTATLNPLFNFIDGYGYRVNIMRMQLYDDKIYFLLYPQENSNETNVGIWVFDRHGLTLAHTKSGVTGFRCAAVVNNVLYIGTGSDGYVYKLDTTKYASTGYVQTSYFDANLPSVTKLFHSVTVKHDPLANGQSIDVYYKFKESDSWTLLGTSDTVDDTEKTLSFAAGITGKKISLKTVLNTTDTSTTPKVTESIMQYKINPTRKWLWTMRVVAKKRLMLLDKTVSSDSATTIRTNLETAQNSSALVTFIDVDGTNYSALFDSIDQSSWVVNQSDVNENEILISLLEA